MWGELHEMKDISIKLEQQIGPTQGKKIFTELGATLAHDVYHFPARQYENWQSESLLYIQLFRHAEPVEAEGQFDEIVAGYPLASRPMEDQKVVLWLLVKLIQKFDATASYQSSAFDLEFVQADWERCNAFLKEQWAEEPGNKSLAIMIDENYRR